MINFIICEDDEIMAKKVVSIINNYIKKQENKASIGLIKDSGEGVIDYVKQNTHKKNIYILDINLKNNQNGMHIAKEIRKYDDNGEMIFLTSYTTMVMYIFKYKLRALDFIDKQDNIEQRILENLENIFNKLSNKKSKEPFIMVKCGTRTYVLKFDEIINIQTTSINGKLRASTIDGQIEFYANLKDINKNLDERFYRSHRGCIINKDYIKMINKDIYNLYILMTNGEKSLLSRNYVRELMSTND
ncbi:MAG: LytTR family DNA-binding domain-containing protein [Tepidibacter sp.]|jgi:two-component system response regulator AgrA|uniref:LytR/AlgR family response regulator transcription factor n=1 Tax=Tepidibacter sp. TaxID=2529387 RepID=UPI0025E53B3A|nr:LytTR family DNA-binding domain-containing protein [Tepidibacter sp.]MCT4507729.1 LytTR family DNA-binding domain-containing protein [Tepidibacter sp.]